MKPRRAQTAGQSQWGKRPIKPAPKPPAPKPAESWWTKHAAPAAPRESFTDAAKQRAEDMRYDPNWSRTDNLKHIGEPKKTW